MILYWDCPNPRCKCSTPGVIIYKCSDCWDVYRCEQCVPDDYQHDCINDDGNGGDYNGTFEKWGKISTEEEWEEYQEERERKRKEWEAGAEERETQRQKYLANQTRLEAERMHQQSISKSESPSGFTLRRGILGNCGGCGCVAFILAGICFLVGMMHEGAARQGEWQALPTFLSIGIICAVIWVLAYLSKG